VQLTKFRLAFVIPTLGKGGAEKVLVNFVNHLDPLQFEVFILCLKKKGELLPLLKEHIHVIDVNSPRAYFSIFALRKHIKKIKPHYLISWLGHVNSILAFYKRLIPGNPVLLCRESSIPSLFIHHYRFPFLFKYFYKFYNRYEGIISQSEAMKKDLVQNFNVNPDKIQTIYNPVVPGSLKNAQITPEAQKFLNNQGKFLLFVGRFSPEKQVHLIIDCMDHLPKDYKLILIGYGGLEDALRRQIKSKPFSQRILIVQDCNDPTPYYRLSDCMLLSSSFEGFPNVLLEANLQGCPAVVYKTRGGAKEIVNDENGIYIEPDDSNDLTSFAAAIMSVCNSGDFNRKEISLHTEEQYNIDRKTQEYINFITGFPRKETSQ
jgi:glycosyltransferase involved in cell wall biosynthesis